MNIREEALKQAAKNVGVRETARNSGPEVDAFLAAVGLDPGHAWCAAFVYSCFRWAAASLRIDNPCPRTAGALRLWEKTPSIWKFDEPMAGDVFVIDHGHGLGHVGFVEVVNGEVLGTVEGNTNGGGSREGDGVYRRTRRRAEANMGFLRFAADTADALTS